jgi:hypothetical protein
MLPALAKAQGLENLGVNTEVVSRVFQLNCMIGSSLAARNAGLSLCLRN